MNQHVRHHTMLHVQIELKKLVDVRFVTIDLDEDIIQKIIFVEIYHSCSLV